MSSLGFELLEVMPNPDVVVVCCGGGGLLAGVAAAIKLSGCALTRIYGVEPEGGKTNRVEASLSFTCTDKTHTSSSVNVLVVIFFVSV